MGKLRKLEIVAQLVLYGFDGVLAVVIDIAAHVDMVAVEDGWGGWLVEMVVGLVAVAAVDSGGVGTVVGAVAVAAVDSGAVVTVVVVAGAVVDGGGVVTVVGALAVHDFHRREDDGLCL